VERETYSTCCMCWGKAQIDGTRQLCVHCNAARLLLLVLVGGVGWGGGLRVSLREDVSALVCCARGAVSMVCGVVLVSRENGCRLCIIYPVGRSVGRHMSVLCTCGVVSVATALSVCGPSVSW